MRDIRIVIDAETESSEDIGLGAYAYCAHPSTDILCFSWREIGGFPGTERIWYPRKTFALAFLVWKICGMHGPQPAIFVPGKTTIPEDLERLVRQGAHFYAHNAFFEQCWWNLIMVKKYGWPEILADHWHCSAAQSAYHGFSQSLERACLGVGTKTAKDTIGGDLMKKMSPIKKRNKKVIANWEYNLYRLGEYCKVDVAAEADLIMSLPPLPENEQTVWLLDQKINFKGLPLDRELVEAGAASSDLLQADAENRLPKLTGGSVRKPGEIARIQKWAAEQIGENLPNLQAPTVAQILQRNDVSAEVKEVLQIRQDAGTAAIKKYAKSSAAIANLEDGRFRGGFCYYGAHTGRWSGKIVQPANMPRAHFSSDEETENAITAIKSGSLEKMKSADTPKKGERPTATNTLTKCVRASITAPDGKSFVALDWAGIELRVLTWFAKDTFGLTRIVELGSSQLYLDMAAAVFGREIKKSDTFEYTVGKAGRLGCGYGMGPCAREMRRGGEFRMLTDDFGRPYGGFVEYARNYGIEITPQTIELAERVVKVYRSENPKVVQLWNRCHKAAVETVETRYPSEVNGVKFSIQKIGRDNALVLRLLSGRELFYPGADIEIRKGRPALTYQTDTNKKWIKSHLYGGLIVENIVQAMSRCLLTPAMLKISGTYDIVSHCYDEVVCETDIDKADECATFMDRVMCEGLPWAKGLPLETEGWIGKRYKK